MEIITSDQEMETKTDKTIKDLEMAVTTVQTMKEMPTVMPMVLATRETLMDPSMVTKI